MPLTAGSQQKDYHALTGSEPDADWWISPQDANEGDPTKAVIAVQLSDLYKSAYKAATEKTVSAGVLTVDQSSHTVQPETGTSDDINTISGMKADTFLVLYVTDEGTDTLTFKHGVDNLSCFGAADVVHSHGMVVFYYDGTVVYVAGGGADTSGWNAYSTVTPTRASADDPIYVLTFAGVDITGLISVGFKLKWTQDGSTRYGIVHAISFSTDTTLTLYGGTDYDVADTASFPITAFNYSTVKAPLNFPPEKTKWTFEVTDTTSRTQATPTEETWYNLGSISIDVPIGAWDFSYQLTVRFGATSSTYVNGKVTLSTANNSESSVYNTALSAIVGATATLNVKEPFHRAFPLELSVKDTYYINAWQENSGTATTMYYENNFSTLILRAVCAYL